MNGSRYSIRNFRQADFDEFVRMSIEAEKLKPFRRYISSQVIAENLRRPNYSPEYDLFVVEEAGGIVGYLDVTPNLEIARVILDCWVQTEHRRRGLATSLFGHAMQRARELEAKAAHVNIAEENIVAKEVLSRLGFARVRHFLELRLEISDVRWSELGQATVELCHLQPGEEHKLTRIQNRSFAGTWGYNPNTVEEITYLLNSISPKDVILAYSGDKVIGYCWTGLVSGGEAKNGEIKGRLFMLGVDPDYRGGGVGESVLLAGLSHLRDRGISVVELTVDSENGQAYDLYRSVGFELQASSLWYEKAIN
ncbi:MAG: GNAT family N-acetyltransferase [Chloroflexi bacterium]|nr:GNAT family N-acetyltransferase [Chloroflexota bacterium]